MTFMRSRVPAALLALCAALAPACAFAAEAPYPDKAIRLVVPFPAGGLVDTMARVLVPAISESMGQSIFIDNRGGASGTIGAGVVAKAPPDGYTLLMVLDSHAINSIVYKSLPYDTDKDLTPISLIARAPMVAAANGQFPPNNLKELIAYSKAHPGAVNFGSVGIGSSGHLTAELFNTINGITMTHVPYKGGAPAQTDLLSGQIQVMWGTAPYVHSLVQGGKLKALGQASATRSVAFPDLPTAAEQGIPNFNVYGWIGMLAPTGTPKPIIDRWQRELAKAVKSPDIAKRLAEQGFDPVVSTPKEFAAFIASEQKTWGKLIKEKNIPIL